MSTKYYWDWEAKPPEDALERFDAFWDDCPAHVGIGCGAAMTGGLSDQHVRVCFAATATRAHWVANTLDQHFGALGQLVRADWEYWSRMHAQYRRKTRGRW